MPACPSTDEKTLKHPASPVTCLSILRRRPCPPPTTLSSLTKLGSAIVVLGHQSGEISFFDLDSPEATLLKVIEVPNCVDGYVIAKPLSLEAVLSAIPSGDKVMALVGVGGEGSRFEPTKVSFYDLHTPPAIVTEIVMTEPVLNVVVGSRCFAVASETALRVYSFSVTLIVKLDTCPNICGTVALAPAKDRRRPSVVVTLEPRMGHIVCGRLDGSRMTLPVRRHQHVRSVATTGSVTACGFEDGSLWVLGALNEGDPKHCSVIGRFKPGKADNAVRSRNRAFYDLPLKRRGLTELVISESEQFVAGVDVARCQIVIFKIVTTTVREFGEGSQLAEFIAGKIFGLSSPSAAQKPVGKTKTSVVLWSFVDLPQVAEELELALHFGSANTLLVCGLNGNASRYAYDPSVCGEKATLVWSSQLCPLRERSASSDSATSTTTVGGNSYRDADTPSTRLGAATHWDVDGQVITFGVNEDASGINEAREESPTKASEDEWIVIAESVGGR
ncbi:hypothetical protein FOZ62_006535 [Perkinsus olseni]|uniref:Uncharacterized protein n=1 Tax=Perkinsus olseni TaxID=32597 RepID=A0A7J6RNM2_PEROL|nr:hypothetical protein FOZ62_006535 [Perkinsus olseni]